MKKIVIVGPKGRYTAYTKLTIYKGLKVYISSYSVKLCKHKPKHGFYLGRVEHIYSGIDNFATEDVSPTHLKPPYK